jgi:enoyl-CoA hydratase/carnithine racemase
MTNGIVYRSDAPVARILIDRPEEGNMLSPEVLGSLKDIAARLKGDREIRVVVIVGAGAEYFSAGILNPELKISLGKERVLEVVALANETFDAIEALPQVVIAGINGQVRAGAVELALACDIRVAAEHVRLAMPEAKWGGFPGAGAPVRLPEIVGYGRALELICTGREIDAQEMERIGLVERLVPSGALEAALAALAGEIAGNGPLAIRGAKQIMGVRREQGFRAARALSDALRHAFEWTADADEGVAAHRENRQPRFTGR